MIKNNLKYSANQLKRQIRSKKVEGIYQKKITNTFAKYKSKKHNKAYSHSYKSKTNIIPNRHYKNLIIDFILY